VPSDSAAEGDVELRRAVREIIDLLDSNDPRRGPGYGEFADMLVSALNGDPVAYFDAELLALSDSVGAGRGEAE